MPRQDIVSEREAREEELRKELIDFLVPDWEYPYKIPNNWVWTKCGYIAEIVTGGTPSKTNPNYYGGAFPFIKPTDLNQGRHVILGSEYLTDEGKEVSRIIPIGSTSVCCIGSIGKCGFLEVEATTNQQINSLIPKINLLYTYYYCCSEAFVLALLENSSATTISIINKSKMSLISFPLPPLAEQERIVKEIESLFSELDKAREIIENILDTFQNRKSAILHQAFSGELTKKWREERSLSLDTWEETTLQDVCTKITDGTHFSPRNYDSGKYMYITAKNIKEYGVDLNKITYVSESDFHTIYSRSNVEKGDVLYIKDGATTGVATVNQIEEPFAMLSSVALLKIDTSISIAKFIVFLLNSSVVKSMMIKKMSGSAITRLTISKIKQAKIIIPPLAEQEEIVRILDDTLQKEDKAKELTDILEQIDLMKKTILAKAFRGELNTNNPDEESALGLLKEISAMPTPKKERVQTKGI